MHQFLTLASELGFNRSEVKVRKSNDQVVRITFWTDDDDSVESNLDDFELTELIKPK